MLKKILLLIFFLFFSCSDYSNSVVNVEISKYGNIGGTLYFLNKNKLKLINIESKKEKYIDLGKNFIIKEINRKSINYLLVLRSIDKKLHLISSDMNEKVFNLNLSYNTIKASPDSNKVIILRKEKDKFLNSFLIVDLDNILIKKYEFNFTKFIDKIYLMEKIKFKIDDKDIYKNFTIFLYENKLLIFDLIRPKDYKAIILNNEIKVKKILYDKKDISLTNKFIYILGEFKSLKLNLSFVEQKFNLENDNFGLSPYDMEIFNNHIVYYDKLEKNLNVYNKNEIYKIGLEKHIKEMIKINDKELILISLRDSNQINDLLLFNIESKKITKIDLKLGVSSFLLLNNILCLISKQNNKFIFLNTVDKKLISRAIDFDYYSYIISQNKIFIYGSKDNRYFLMDLELLDDFKLKDKTLEYDYKITELFEFNNFLFVSNKDLFYDFYGFFDTIDLNNMKINNFNNFMLED